MKKLILIALLGLGVFAESCKKEKNDTQTPTTGSSYDLIRDSVFLYAKEAYYWYDALPTYATFNPRGFTGTDDLGGLTKEVNAISQYKINPATSQPYEAVLNSSGTVTGTAKYSFIDEGETSTRLNAVTGDFGFVPIYYNTVDNLVIKYVNIGSPADKAGIKRGYRITKINGNTSFSYDNGGTNTQFVVNAYSNSSAITMTLQRQDGTTFDVSLTAAVYTVNPIITSKVIDAGNGKKVGYIVFNSFVTAANADPLLDAAFATFKSSNITDLIVDLRYDGGGYVETSEYLANLIAPASASGKLMYNTYYNTTLANGKGTLPQIKGYDFSVKGNAVNFGTTHPLSLTRVFFLVTGSTASASELTINNLRPYMNVQIVGRTTYGKPVGFFAIKINKYSLYIPEFETKNGSDQGGYYTGMVPASSDYPGYSTYDDLSKDFGDVNENMLAVTLGYIKNGSYKASSVTIQSLAQSNALTADQQSAVAGKFDNDTFKGMIAKPLVKTK